MEHLPHLGRRAGDEQSAVEHADAFGLRWQELVRLAVRRGARKDPPRVSAGRGRQAERDRRAAAEALLRSRALHSGGAVLRADRASEESERNPRHTAPGALEHREEVTDKAPALL